MVSISEAVGRGKVMWLRVSQGKEKPFLVTELCNKKLTTALHDRLLDFKRVQAGI
jgi:hypothetical protein